MSDRGILHWKERALTAEGETLRLREGLELVQTFAAIIALSYTEQDGPDAIRTSD